MKKSFLNILTFGFLPSLMAQTQLNLTFGSGLYVVAAAKTSSLPAMHLQIGANLTKQALDGKLNFGFSFNYHRMYWTDLVLPAPSNSGGYLLKMYHAKDYTSPYNIWSVPIYAQWHTKKLKPMLGFAFDYKYARSQNWALDASSDFDHTKYKPYISDFKMSLWTGIEFTLQKNRAIRLNYTHELIGNEPVRQPYATPEYHKVRNYRLDVTFVTRLCKF